MAKFMKKLPKPSYLIIGIILGLVLCLVLREVFEDDIENYRPYNRERNRKKRREMKIAYKKLIVEQAKGNPQVRGFIKGKRNMKKLAVDYYGRYSELWAEINKLNAPAVAAVDSGSKKKSKSRRRSRPARKLSQAVKDQMWWDRFFR